MTRFLSFLWLLFAMPIISAHPLIAAVDVPDNFVHETLVTGLSEPNSLASLPDGRLLFTEQRTAKVRMVVNGHLAATDPLLVVPNVNSSGYERGLQGIAVDPQWPQRPYLYFTLNRLNGQMRLVRYTASGALTDPNAESLTLGSPMILIDNIPDAASNHNGGTLRFGKDGHLYMSLGEDADPCGAQNLTTLKGVLLRIKVTTLPATGTGPMARAFLVPESRSFSSPDSNAMLVFALGLRNPWRFHIDPVTGAVLLGDVGEGTYEELDEVPSGGNLGWPFREANSVRTVGGCTEPGGTGRTAYHGPIVTLTHTDGIAAILTAGVYRPNGGASVWPASYHGSVFYSDYFVGFLRRITKSGSTWTTPSPVPGQPNSTDWATGLSHPVDFVVGRDGNLWCLSQFNATGGGATGSLARIRYTGTPVTDVPGSSVESIALSGSPNPFASSTLISLSLPSAEHVRLDAFDTRGRRVRTLIDEALPAGARQITWDGTDDHGEIVAPGIYFLRLSQGSAIGTARLLRVQ